MHNINLDRSHAHDYYNAEPVFYCKQCLSLRIKSIPGIPDTDFCDSCNSTNIGKTNIKAWEVLYEDRYGYKYLEKEKY